MAETAQKSDGASAQTEMVVAALYDAFFRNDSAGMISLFSNDISLRFLGQVDVCGVTEARRFFGFASGLLTDVDFRIRRRVIDGEWAAVIWDETARTQSGEPWVNHGVDVVHVEDGRITALHENNDVRLVVRYFPRYDPGAPTGDQTAS